MIACNNGAGGYEEETSTNQLPSSNALRIIKISEFRQQSGKIFHTFYSGGLCSSHIISPLHCGQTRISCNVFVCRLLPFVTFDSKFWKPTSCAKNDFARETIPRGTTLFKKAGTTCFEHYHLVQTSLSSVSGHSKSRADSCSRSIL